MAVDLNFGVCLNVCILMCCPCQYMNDVNIYVARRCLYMNICQAVGKSWLDDIFSDEADADELPPSPPGVFCSERGGGRERMGERE